ncbi:MAG: isoprenylcysteine carboxylmethyltransferase family protein [Candidatus Acidiferrales bacterium]
MKATEFEFRYRFWLIGAIFWFGFLLYKIDPLNMTQYLVNETVGEHSSHADLVARSLLLFGAFLVLLTALLRTWASSYLRTDVVQDPKLRAETVLADGPYRHVRNPLYLGNVFLAAGMGLLASRLGFAFIVLGMFIFCLRLIVLEEANLTREQGESYLAFCRRVPRLWPALRARVPASGLQPKWKQAFLGEMFVWGFFAAMVVFAITINQKAFFLIVGLALLLYIVRGYAMAARKKREANSGNQ